MEYAEILRDWYRLTLSTIAARLSEEKGIEITSDAVGNAIADKFGFTDNTQVHAKLYEEGLNLYQELKGYNFPETI